MSLSTGLILEGAPLIVPALYTYRKCTQLYQSIEEHSNSLRSTYTSFLVQKILFEHECRDILVDVVGSAGVEKVWEHIEKILSHIEDSGCGVAKIISGSHDRSVRLTEAREDSLWSTLTALRAMEFQLQTFLNETKRGGVPGKVLVRKFLVALRHQNENLRSQRPKRKAGRATTAIYKSPELQPQMLSLPPCSECNCVPLNLEQGLKKSPGGVTEFRFILTSENIPCAACTSLLITNAFASNKEASTTTPIPTSSKAESDIPSPDYLALTEESINSVSLLLGNKGPRPRRERFQLARFLAMSILQDISSLSETGHSENDPFAADHPAAETVAEREQLLSLADVLTEIGVRDTDEKKRGTLVESVGKRYAEVVDTCLEMGAEGFDRRTFYEQVVRKLDQCCKKLDEDNGAVV